MRFSPTEFTEFTEFVSVGTVGMPYPPTSVRIRAHLWEALLCQKFLCVPCVLWKYLFSHRIHRIHRICQRGYGRDAIPSYICAHPCSSVGGSSLPEVSVCSVRSVGISFLPQNSQNSQNLAVWVWQGCHTLLHLCSSVPSVGVLSLQEVLCIRCIPWELLHRLFGWCRRDCCTPWRNPQK